MRCCFNKKQVYYEEVKHESNSTCYDKSIYDANF